MLQVLEREGHQIIHVGGKLSYLMHPRQKRCVGGYGANGRATTTVVLCRAPVAYIVAVRAERRCLLSADSRATHRSELERLHRAIAAQPLPGVYAFRNRARPSLRVRGMRHSGYRVLSLRRSVFLQPDSLRPDRRLR